MENLVLELNHIEKSFMSKNVLTIDCLKVYENEKIGIIGGNGEGKSTLLNLIAGKLFPDSGKIHRTIDFEYYEQIKENIRPDYMKIDPEYLSRLDVPDHKVAHLSGGEQTRLRLAEYFSTYQFGLLMDEPTTHLDTEGIQFLVDQLKYYYGTLMVVSHDRYFLDEVVDTIWEVKEGKVTVYPGNYSSYQQQKEQELVEQQNAYEKFTKEKYRLEKAAKEKHKHAEKLTNISKKQKSRSVKPDRLSSSKQKDTVQKAAHKSAKALQKRAEQLKTVEKVENNRSIQFPEPENLQMHNDFPIIGQKVTIQKGEKCLFNEANFQFPLEKRIGIVGPNGSGKSTLLEHIITDGEGITLSNKIVFSVYKQMAYQLAEDKTILEFLKQDTHMKESIIRSILNNLGFSQTEIVKKLITNLSGGEATRLVIAKLFTIPSNILILDEPTNFIDVQTIEALEVLVKSYKGTVLFTSHDKYFVENVAEQIWRIEDQQLKLIEY